MANVKITDLTAYTDPASTDVIPIVDLVNDQTKKVTLANIFQNFPEGTAAAPGIAFDGDGNTGIYSPGADQIAITTAGTGRLFISDDGKVGIGVSDPSSYNVSADDLVIADPNGFNSGISINITDNTGSSNIWFGDSDGEGRGTITYGHGASDSLVFNVGGSAALRIEDTGTVNFVGAGSVGVTQAVSFNGSAPVDSLIVDSSGRVGIGVTPESILHVKGSQPSIIIEKNAGLGSFLVMKTTGSSTNDFVLAAASGESEFFSNQYEFKNVAGTTEYMRIDSSGRLGVGTSSPSGKLHIKDGGYRQGIVLERSASTVDRGFIYIGDGTNSTIADEIYLDASNTAFHFRQGANGTTETVTFKSDGKVGIGTTGPSTKLSVIDTSAGNIVSQLFIGNQSNNNGTGARIDFSALGSLGATGSIENVRDGSGLYSLRFKTFQTSSNSEAMRIDGSGRLLVGTSSQTNSSLLTVEGNTSNNAGAAELTLQRGESATSITAGESLGHIYFADNSANKFAEIAGWADATAGSSDYPGRLVFSTTGDGNSAPTERLTLYNNGYFKCLGIYNLTTANAANVFSGGAGYLYRSTSSIKYKSDVENLQDEYADALLQCRPVWYRSTCAGDSSEYSYWGFIAEEVAEIDPRLVHWKTVDVTYDEKGAAVETPCDPEPEGVAYDRFVPHLLNLIKRQKEQIEAMEARLSALEAQ